MEILYIFLKSILLCCGAQIVNGEKNNEKNSSYISAYIDGFNGEFDNEKPKKILYEKV